MSETKYMPARDNGAAAKVARMVAPDDAESGEDIKLTPLRRAVLQTLVTAGRPLGAYDLVTEIEAGTGSVADALSNQKIPKNVEKHIRSYYDQLNKGN